MGCRQAVRHETLTLARVGSNPAIPANTKGTRGGALCVDWDGTNAPEPRSGVGSHSPPEDLQARLQDAGRANLRRRRISDEGTKGHPQGCPLCWLGWHKCARAAKRRRFAFAAQKSESVAFRFFIQAAGLAYHPPQGGISSRAAMPPLYIITR